MIPVPAAFSPKLELEAKLRISQFIAPMIFSYIIAYITPRRNPSKEFRPESPVNLKVLAEVANRHAEPEVA